MAGRHSPSLPGRQTSAGNLVSRESRQQGGRDDRQQRIGTAGKIVRTTSLADGRWRRRQGRSATSAGMIGDGREDSRSQIADVAGKIANRRCSREDRKSPM